MHEFYEIGVPKYGRYEEILNSDKGIYFWYDQYNGVQLHTIKRQTNQFLIILNQNLVHFPASS